MAAFKNIQSVQICASNPAHPAAERGNFQNPICVGVGTQIYWRRIGNLPSREGMMMIMMMMLEVCALPDGDWVFVLCCPLLEKRFAYNYCRQVERMLQKRF